MYTTPSLPSSPRGSSGEESICRRHSGDPGSIPGLGRTGEGNGNLLQYACLGNLVDRGAWWAIQSMGLQRVGHNWVIKQQTAYHIFFIYSTVERHIGCFHVSAIRDCAMITGVQVSFRVRIFVFSGYMPRSGTAGSCGNSIFSFLKEPPYRSPHPLQHLWTGDF